MFAKKINDLLGNTLARNILGEAGRAYALRHWSASAKADEMLNFYRALQPKHDLNRVKQAAELMPLKKPI